MPGRRVHATLAAEATRIRHRPLRLPDFRNKRRATFPITGNLRVVVSMLVWRRGVAHSASLLRDDSEVKLDCGIQSTDVEVPDGTH